MIIYGMRGLAAREQAYELLARAAAEHWQLDPLPPISRSGGGKPFFTGPEGREFNLSHSGALALCALDRTPVGVDIQMVRSWRPSLPRRVCTQVELDWLGTGEDFWPRFTQLWALKESRVKCTGTGLRGQLSTIRIPLPHCGAGPYQLDGLWFQTYAGPGWRAAACGLTLPPCEIFWTE